jgi:hypothetical protein
VSGINEKYAPRIIQDKEVTWIPLSMLADEYNRSPRLMRRWAESGFIVELGYALRYDETGHWIVGVPHGMYRNFRTYRNPSVVNHPANL